MLDRRMTLLVSKGRADAFMGAAVIDARYSRAEVLSWVRLANQKGPWRDALCRTGAATYGRWSASTVGKRPLAYI